MIVNAGCQLEYDTTTPTAFIFQIQAAHADGQTVVREAIKLPSGCRFEAIVDPVTQNRIMRTVLGPGVIQVGYEATIETPGVADAADAVLEIDFMGLPAETLPFLTPSRSPLRHLHSILVGNVRRSGARPPQGSIDLRLDLHQHSVSGRFERPELFSRRRFQKWRWRMPRFCAPWHITLQRIGHSCSIRQRLRRRASAARFSRNVPSISQRSEWRCVVHV